MKYRLIILFAILSNPVLVSQTKGVLIQKFWYVHGDTIIDPDKVKFVSFSSEKPKKDYNVWVFSADGVLGYGSYRDNREEGDITDYETPKNNFTVVQFREAKTRSKWKIRRNILSIGSLKFKIVELSDTKLTIEKK